MRLFSYCIPVDDGAAPNPFWGICTLTICKPVIRRVANVGDWIVGVGSKNVNGDDFSGKIVYAMQITQKMTLKEYDQFCRDQLPEKIADINNSDQRIKLGDCIYDYSNGEPPSQRLGVHNAKNFERDLGGQFALLSDHFYYFGDQAIDIPPEFRSIIKQGQAHKSNSNEPVKEEFIEWLETRGYRSNKLFGKPQIEIDFNKKNPCECGEIRSKSHQQDELISDSRC